VEVDCVLHEIILKVDLIASGLYLEDRLILQSICYEKCFFFPWCNWKGEPEITLLIFEYFQVINKLHEI
jgi:hypothetical protein